MVDKTKLMKLYEKETGKHAVWAGKITQQYKNWKRLRRELHKKRTRLEEKKEEVKDLKKEVIRTEKKVYSGHELLIRIIGFIAFIYLFLLGIAFLKQGVLQLGGNVTNYIISNLSTSDNALSLGWLVSYLSQSGSVIAFITIILADIGALDVNLLFWALIGTIIGNTSTSLIAVLLAKPANAHDLRHGFEIGIANLVYTFILVLLVVTLELLTGFFTNTSIFLKNSLSGLIKPGLTASPIDLITNPIVVLFNSLFSFLGNWLSLTLILIGGVLFALSLKNLGRVVIDLLGGKRHARSIINNYLKSDWQAFIIGFSITLLMASNSASLSLLVPLAVAGLIKFRQTIPYAIGTITGSFIDVLLGSLAVASPFALSAGIMFTLISLMGFLFIISSKPSDLIYNTTRLISRRVLRMNKKSVISLLLLMLAVPLLILAL